MAKSNLKEFAADHEGGDVLQGGVLPDAVPGEGGDIAPRLGDVKAQINPVADEVDEETPGNDYVKEDLDLVESFNALFEGMDLTEDFKNKVSLVFESAVHEAVTSKIDDITESLEEKFENDLQESVEEAMTDIVENLDNYLDYVVKEWMSENEVAIEAGIKVEMAESLMNSLKTVFYEHNIEIDESTIDTVAALEEELVEAKTETNKAINENINLIAENKALKADKVFSSLTEGLTATQVERLKLLSEKLDTEDLEEYKSDLGVLKESFFKTPAKKILTEEVNDDLVVEEVATKKPASPYDSVNIIAEAITRITK